MRGGGQVEEPLFDGVLELLDALEADGWLLAVATGKSDRGLKHCLESTASTPASSRCRPPTAPVQAAPVDGEQAIAEAGAAPETTIVIGDTSFDMAMARAAGAAAIGAGWGYHEPRS
jgi:phosphoglycolate phosphatase